MFFSMDIYYIVLKLKDSHVLKLNADESLDIEEIDIKNISTNIIESISVQCGTCISEDGEEQTEAMSPYTFEANKLIAIVDSRFSNSISEYSIGTYCVDDTCTMCNDLWEYGYTLFINKVYWSNIDFFQYLDCIIKKLSAIELPPYYSLGTRIFDDYEINILPSNTKNRRLGYLKLILYMFEKCSKFPVISLYRDFERYVQPYVSFLLVYKSKKGVVVETKTGNSAKPYIELAESLGLIHKTATYYELGKMGKTYLSIEKVIGKSTENPFNMSDFDKAFFLEQILKRDYLYMYAIMELICKASISSYFVLKEGFQQHLLHNISYLLNQNNNVDSAKLLKLKIIERRVKAWDKPMSYLEHILMPRINWLYDLGLIEYENKNSFTFTHNGIRCFMNLASWHDLKMQKVANPTNYLSKYYMRIVDDIYILGAKQYTSNMEELLVDYINQSFELFKTIAPNRTTFSLAVNFCKYMLLWRNSVMIDVDDIKWQLEYKLSKFYIYKYQTQYKDGYIQKR